MREDNQTPQEIFEARVRRVWYEEEWYYAIVDVVEVLTDSPDPSSYWRNLKKQRLSKEENAAEVFDTIVQLKLQARDNRLRFTDTSNRQTILRIIQSIPSPRAEPFKLWLAQVGDERIEEIEHPEQAIERVRQTYRAKGYDDAWIEERIKNDLVRNELTDEWKFRGAKEGQEFAMRLTQFERVPKAEIYSKQIRKGSIRWGRSKRSTPKNSKRKPYDLCKRQESQLHRLPASWVFPILPFMNGARH